MLHTSINKLSSLFTLNFFFYLNQVRLASQKKKSFTEQQHKLPPNIKDNLKTVIWFQLRDTETEKMHLLTF